MPGTEMTINYGKLFLWMYESWNYFFDLYIVYIVSYKHY